MLWTARLLKTSQIVWRGCNVTRWCVYNFAPSPPPPSIVVTICTSIAPLNINLAPLLSFDTFGDKINQQKFMVEKHVPTGHDFFIYQPTRKFNFPSIAKINRNKILNFQDWSAPKNWSVSQLKKKSFFGGRRFDFYIISRRGESASWGPTNIFLVWRFLLKLSSDISHIFVATTILLSHRYIVLTIKKNSSCSVVLGSVLGKPCFLSSLLLATGGWKGNFETWGRQASVTIEQWSS